MAALSPAAPTLPIEPAIPWRPRARTNFRERNCDPRSLCRMHPERLAAGGLLQQLVTTVHPAAGGGPFQWARAVRGAVAGLLRRDVEATAQAGRHLVFEVDLDEVRLGDPATFTGPALARTVLDLAAADAAAGLPLAERLRAWPRIAQADAHLPARPLAAHLAAHPPHTPDPHTAPDPGAPALALAEAEGGETGGGGTGRWRPRSGC
jgi:hypothetical protein